MKAVLLLEDGTVFKGKGFGAKTEVTGEVVFNTSMTGYEEILTDPSYNEQIITMTYSLIGNYGINDFDLESDRIQAKGLIVKEVCTYPSNWRSTLSLNDFLVKYNIPGIEGIDTRMLVKHIREKGAMKGILCTKNANINELKKRLLSYPGLVGRDIVKDASLKKAYSFNDCTFDLNTNSYKKQNNSYEYKVAVYDFGVKQNILRLLNDHKMKPFVFPYNYPAEKILEQGFDGVFLSNGPGDPEPLDYAIENTKNILGSLPIFGICLGHQILCLAMGAKTYKLKFGHRGANHPVKNIKTGHIEITSQNHGFCADISTLNQKEVDITHVNLNDNTVEGIKCKKMPAFSVQYHPEASPGPHDSEYLFKDFYKLIQDHNNKK